MAFKDGPHPALLIDDVLEKILEYAASGEHFIASFNLRLVCKQWREVAFKALCRSRYLPRIYLSTSRKSQNTELSPEFFRKRFPRICPSHLALSDPLLPIELRFMRLPSSEDEAFIREFSSYIASVSIRLSPFDEHQRVNENPTNDFKLPNLTRMEVRWDFIWNYEPWEQLVTHILNTSKHVGVLIYIYPTVTQDFPWPYYWPVAPAKVTHVEFPALATNMKILINRNNKQLIKLNLTLADYAEYCDQTAESVAITEILEHHSATLQKVAINKDSWATVPIKAIKLPSSTLQNLRRLKTDFPILLSKGNSHSTKLPKLKDLKYIVGYHPVQESDGLKVSHEASPSLVYLTLSWGSSPKRWVRGKQEKMMVKVFEKESFPVYPELLELNVNKMPFCFALALMPKVFTCMTNLTSLSLGIVNPREKSRHFGNTVLDLSKMLTGVTTKDVPKDEELWCDLLKDKADAITNLKHLTYLEIRTNKDSKCVLARFIFHAAFFQMQNLKKLLAGGGIEVEEEMIKEWESRGRSIKVTCKNPLQR